MVIFILLPRILTGVLSYETNLGNGAVEWPLLAGSLEICGAEKLEPGTLEDVTHHFRRPKILKETFVIRSPKTALAK